MTAFLAAIGYEHWILHVLLALPLAAMPLILVFPVRAARWIALVVALIEFFLGIGLWWAFDPANPGIQFATDLPWLSRFGIGYRIGIDGLSGQALAEQQQCVGRARTQRRASGQRHGAQEEIQPEQATAEQDGQRAHDQRVPDVPVGQMAPGPVAKRRIRRAHRRCRRGHS